MAEVNFGRKVAIVTGGARPWGLGRQVTLGLAHKGMDITVVDIHDDWGKDATDSITKETGQRAGYVRTDIAKRRDVAAMVDRVLRTFGRIDVLVNNAAIVFSEPVDRMTDESFDQVVDINLRGTALCCQAVLEPMRRQGGGRIINVASAITAEPVKGLALYAASKGGVAAFSKVLAMETARDNIIVTVVSPGMMHTAMGTDVGPTEDDFRRGRHQLINRPLYPAEVAEVIVYAATSSSHALTGQTLHANGGSIMV
jgi:NAD(P)-dependent dehydrogenase (short-subunit alcohol dehydrogenase family)